MTISKKLLIDGALIVGMQPIAQAHTSEISDEISQVLDFARTLRQVNNKDELKIAEWLEELAFKYEHSDHMICWLCCDISIIANVINNPQLTMQSKISTLSQKMK